MLHRSAAAVTTPWGQSTHVSIIASHAPAPHAACTS